MTRLVLSLAGVLAASFVVVLPGPADAESCGGVRNMGGAWTTIDFPPVEAASSVVNLSSRGPYSWAIDPSEGGRKIYFSDGWIVHHSSDGGCNWAEIFSLESAPVDCGGLSRDTVLSSLLVQTQIKEIAVGGEGPTKSVFLKVERTSWGLSITCLIRSGDGGQTWEPVANPVTADDFDATMGAGELVVTDSPSVLLTKLGPQPLQALVTTDDLGDSWSKSALPGTYSYNTGSAKCSSLDVDESDPKFMWGFFYSNVDLQTALHRSVDGGGSWELSAIQEDLPWHAEGQTLNSLEAWGKDSRNLAVTTSGYDNDYKAAVWISKDEGRSWVSMNVPTNAWGVGCAVAGVSSRHLFVTGGQNNVMRYDTKSGEGFVIKSTPFTEDFAGDFQENPRFVRGSGLYVLISPLGGAPFLARYTGLGT